MRITSVEIASAPMFLISTRLRELFLLSFGFELRKDVPLTRPLQVRQILDRLREKEFGFAMTGFDRRPERCASFIAQGSELKFEVWGKNAEEAIVRAAGLVSLYRFRKGFPKAG